MFEVFTIIILIIHVNIIHKKMVHWSRHSSSDLKNIESLQSAIDITLRSPRGFIPWKIIWLTDLPCWLKCFEEMTRFLTFFTL